jgi:hypothetical protein
MNAHAPIWLAMTCHVAKTRRIQTEHVLHNERCIYVPLGLRSMNCVAWHVLYAHWKGADSPLG